MSKSPVQVGPVQLAVLVRMSLAVFHNAQNVYRHTLVKFSHRCLQMYTAIYIHILYSSAKLACINLKR